MKGMLSIDVDRCLSCKTCELECAIAHSQGGTLFAVMRSGEKVQRRIVVEPAAQLAVPLQLRHCEDAPCVAVCPTQAMHKNGVEFPVLVDETLCIGCHACISVCPFGVIFASRMGRAVVKCDLCVSRLAQGQQTGMRRPAARPTRSDTQRQRRLLGMRAAGQPRGSWWP